MIVTVLRSAACMALGAFFVACGEDGPSIITPMPDTVAEQGTTGASLYRYHCAACHGLDGRPLVTATDDLLDYQQSLDSFNIILSSGPGLMPSYDYLDSAQRALIYNHVKTF